jgi:flagellar motor switch protein FliN/FliY
MSVLEVEYPDLTAPDSLGNVLLTPNLSLLKHVEVTLDVKLGEATLSIEDLFALRSGSVIALDRLVDEPVELLLNDKVVAVGQLAVSGDHLGVRITQILEQEISSSL